MIHRLVFDQSQMYARCLSPAEFRPDQALPGTADADSSTAESGGHSWRSTAAAAADHPHTAAGAAAVTSAAAATTTATTTTTDVSADEWPESSPCVRYGKLMTYLFCICITQFYQNTTSVICLFPEEIQW